MVKFFYTIGLCIFLTTNLYAQKKQVNKYAYCQKINKEYSIVFLKFNKTFKLYSSPRILWQNKLIKIKDFDDNNFSGGKIQIAPNKKYVVMDNIIKGFIQKEKDSILHENYTCVLINVNKAKIITSMQTDCGGKWNTKSGWENDGKLIFIKEK